ILCAAIMRNTVAMLWGLVVITAAAVPAAAAGQELDDVVPLDDMVTLDNVIPLVDVLPVDNTINLQNSENETVTDYGELDIEHKGHGGCWPTPGCTHAGGYCVRFRSDCNGTIALGGCKTKKCKCCKPDQRDSTTTPMPCPVVTCPTCTTPDLEDTPCSACDLGDYCVGNKCYFIPKGGPMTWPEAKLECIKQSGRLAEPRNILEFWKAFGTNANLGFWLGGTDKKREGQWRWCSDKTKVGNIGWIHGHPRNNTHGGDCLYLKRDQYPALIDYHCNKVYEFLCERKAVKALP
ncbi:unnamed protein product, partial [Meganyctiphanes norvegica]